MSIILRRKASIPGWLKTLVPMLLAGTVLLAVYGDDTAIDPVRGRALMQKWQRGETLTAEESAYLDRVRAEIRRRAAQRNATITPVPNPAAASPNSWSSLVPLTDLTNTYKGQSGGLYGAGQNQPPAAQLTAWSKACNRIQPLDGEGHPAKDGKIVLLTLGFSNTLLESEDFVRSGSVDPEKSPNVVPVNGAIGGRAAVMWAYDGSELLPRGERERLEQEMEVLHMPKTQRKGRRVPQEQDTWPTVELRLHEAGVTPKQVQAVWMKHVEAGAAALGEFPAHAKTLEADMVDILNIAQERFPNLRAAFFSSRTYGGWASPTAGSPEPYAYETAFAVRGVIQRQIEGDPLLNSDPTRGEVKSPVTLWGPYLWACGNRPRGSDGMVWTEEDVRSNDHMHPSQAGCKKVTGQLLKFLKTDPGTRVWFLVHPAAEKHG